MLMVLLLLGYLLLSPLELSQLAKYSMAVFLSVPNMLLLKSGDYFSADADLNPLLMTWSLGIEEQFYIVLPFILLLAVRLRRTMTGVVLLAQPAVAGRLPVVNAPLQHSGVLSAANPRLGTGCRRAAGAVATPTSHRPAGQPLSSCWLALLPVLAACLMIGARSPPAMRIVSRRVTHRR
ncbi:hypothetical protein E05_38580 [Plautia stali symbiont]|nr:hypothetical protein E05_38580 [Plautia stali symbiont]